MAGLSSEQLLLSAFGGLVVGTLVECAFVKNWRAAGWVGVVFMAAAGAALWSLAARAFTVGDATIHTGLAFRPLSAALTFHIDKLSAIFLLIVPFVGLAAALYAVEYMRKIYPSACPARYYPFALLLMAAIVGVVTTSDLFFFLIFWEIMTLTSWVLVWFDRENEAKVRAAWEYFVVIHVATALMIVGAVVIYSRVGSFGFADVSRAFTDLARTSPWLLHVLLGLFLIGLSTKAGMFPFGGWLPQAHPAAPGPASAIFAGAMIKTGIYGLARFFFDLLRVPEMTAVWGAIIAVLGTASIFIGTLTALRQDDSKRVLSFHTIGQVGYMLLGLGTGIFFIHTNPFLATVGFIAGLYHAINHACYKSLLFLNVGAAEYWTGTRDLNKIGGLGALMPVTMVATIIASLSIAGIPPFNGFVSKWLIYQATINGGTSVPLFLLLGIVAIFSSVVTLASFMKVIGSMFLGNLATAGKSIPGDVPMSMQIAQISISMLCVILGVVPVLPLALLHGTAQDILGQSFVPQYAHLFGSSASGVTLSFGTGTSGAWNPMIAIVAMAVCTALAYSILRAAQAPHRQTVGWYCGEESPPEELRSKAHGFCLPFKEAFANVYPTVRIPKIPALRLPRAVLDLDKWLYNPLVSAGARFTDGLSRTHSGLPQMYMLWQIVGVVIVVGTLFWLLS